MNTQTIANTAVFQEWIMQRLEISQVKDKLKAMGHDEESVNIYLKEFNKFKYGKRQQRGFILIGVGSVIGFISTVITMINPFPEFVGFFLYGVTSFAILVALVGFYFVFE